jgi:putative membrane protein
MVHSVRYKEAEVTRLSISTLLAVGVLAPAFGQTPNPAPGNPAGMPPQTREAAPGVPAARETNQADRTFVREGAIGGLAEVELGKLAEQQASNRSVKEFAQRMIRDHGAANEKLAAAAKADRIALPDNLDQEHQALRTRLGQSRGTQFDQAYLQAQVIDHQKTAQLLQYEVGSGENAELKQLASDLLPVVLDHLRTAKAIAAELYKSADASPREQQKQRR